MKAIKDSTYKLIKETVRKIDTKWIQPILSSNGTFGGDTMAVTSSVSPKNGSLYQLFDGSTANFCRMADAQYVYVTVYFPTPIKITGVKIINHHNSSNGFGITAFEVQNSSDNSTWQTIGSTSITLADGATATATCTTQNYFKYMRLKLTSSTTYGYQASMKEITIYAEKQINDSSYKDVVLYKAMR